MRVYLPATSTIVRALLREGVMTQVPFTAFAVTPGLREWYRDDDVEALEYAAMNEAARASLRLVDADPDAARRRIVVALDADDGIEVRDDLERGVVRLQQPIELDRVASVHVDDAEAEPVVRAAARSIIEADLGDRDAQQLVDDAEGFELSWYATSELQVLLAGL